MKDEQLIRNVIAGDQQAEDIFVERYRGLILGLARGRFGLRDPLAEDILQATIARLWEHDRRALRAWRGKGRFASYLTVIVTHLCLQQRELLAKQSASEAEPIDSTWVDPSTDADGDLAQRERWQAVDETLIELSARDRLLIALRFRDERSAKDIAQVLGTKPGTIRKAVHDALRRLRRKLSERRPELFEPPQAELIQPDFSREKP